MKQIVFNKRHYRLKKTNNMGGKKKSIATKLAKMSDEERARYLQHRAEIEEESKTRKEQLINKFMKVNFEILMLNLGDSYILFCSNF